MVCGLYVVKRSDGFAGVYCWSSTRSGDLAVGGFFAFFCVVALAGFIEVIGVFAEFGTLISFMAGMSKLRLG